MSRSSLLIIAISILAISCGSTQYRDPSKDKGSEEFGAREYKTTANKMVGSLYNYLKIEWNKPALIRTERIKNDTSEHIDTKFLADEIVNSLVQKRIEFLDASLTKEQIKEIEKGMTGLIDPDSAVPAGNLKSPNFFLSGNISEKVLFDSGKKIQYLVVTMKLIEVKTGQLRWQDRQEFLKATPTTKISY
jgi:uncharacterized protein (TIGR02722 family)